MRRDSAGSKVAVVVGIGAVAIGLAAVRARYVPAPRSRPDRVAAVAAPSPASAPKDVANGGGGDRNDKPGPAAGQPVPAARPTQADRFALLGACSAGDQASVEALHAKGVNLDGTLGNAATSGNAALVGWLLGHGVSAKEDAELSVPPLLLADEHDAVVNVLLARGAPEPTLAKAVAVAAPRAVARLLAKGASASSKTAEGEPVLMVAVRDSVGAKRRAIVDALLKAGADPDVKHDDETPLAIAVASAAGHADETEKAGDRAIDIAGKLVAKGAKVGADVLVSAMSADEERRGALLDVLLAGTLERNATVRAIAHAAEDRDVVSLKKIAAKGVTWPLLEAGAAPPLANAIVASDVVVVKALLEAGAPMDRMGEDGDTALLAAVAAAAGDSDEAVRVVRVLLDRGASPNKRGRDGRTALYAAAQQGSEALVALLVAKGARVDDAVDGMTPLEAADSRGHDAVVKLLAARGAKHRKVARID